LPPCVAAENIATQKRFLTPFLPPCVAAENIATQKRFLTPFLPPCVAAENIATQKRIPDTFFDAEIVLRLILGIDGGGTKALAWLADAQRDVVLGKGRGGPANPRSVGVERATAGLDQAIERAFQDAGLIRQPAAAACLALAGSDRESDREPVQLWARQRNIGARVSLVHDAEPILAAGTSQGWGIALIAGTGSFAFGRGRDGHSDRVGGWGHIFGDEGSGYALAIAGLKAASHAADGRGPSTSLLPRLQEALGVDGPMGLIEAVYHSEMDRQGIAALATVVVQASDGGDPVAQRLLEVAANDLSQMVATLAGRLTLSRDHLPLALGGSLLLKSDTLKLRVSQLLAQAHAMTPTINEVAEPVRGTLTIAREML
jgi:N-acetylglucosamine kinase-like BadF-type ATPase